MSIIFSLLIKSNKKDRTKKGCEYFTILNNYINNSKE